MADTLAEDFLEHHGVMGMHWGHHRLLDLQGNELSRADDKRVRKETTAYAKKMGNKAPKPVSYREARRITSTYKNPSRRTQVNNAMNKKLSTNPFSDDRSAKTVKLGKASTGLALGSLGSYGLSLVAKDPRVRFGLQAATIALAAGTVGTSIAENRSAGHDLLNKYGN